MNKKLKFFFVSLFITLFGLTSLGVKAAGNYIESINVLLEAQQNATKDSIRYISTLELTNDAKLSDIEKIDVELTLSKAGEETKHATGSLTNVYNRVGGANGKPKADNTYYAVYTITSLAKYYPGWTLSTTFEYNYKDSTKEDTNTIVYNIPESYELLSNGNGTFATTYQCFADNIQDGQILQCFCWSYKEIMNYLPQIAAQGFTAIQTSPVQVCKQPTAGDNAKGAWWAYYQPAAFTVDDTGDNALGTPEEFGEMCQMAHEFGVKVVVDVVANHLGNQWIADTLCERAYYYEWEIAGMSAPGNINAKEGEPGYIPYTGKYWVYDKGYAAYKGTDNCSDTKEVNTYYYKDTLLFHPYMIQNNDDPENVTQGNIGMMDLDTSNEIVQDAVADYLEELIDYGVDGFRFDAAKHIETPYDAISSNFWPYVIGRAKTRAATYGRDIYAYGEILNRPGEGRSLSWYTDCGVAITDSGLGHGIVENGGSGFGDFNGADGNNYIDYKEHMVTWAESHDNYMGTQDTHNKSENIINRSYAILSARKDFATLYCARFEDYEKSMLGSVACLNGWSYPSVGAVNMFHNFYSKYDAEEYCHSNNGFNIIERYGSGCQGGAVLVGSTGACSVPVSHMANGTYKDYVTGNTFTVSNGTLSGTVGEEGIAVIYSNTSIKEGSCAITVEGDFSFYTTNNNISITIINATSATLIIDGEEYAITSGAALSFGADMAPGDKKTITIEAIDKNNNKKTKTVTYTKTEAPKTYKMHFNKPDDWTSISANLYKNLNSEALNVKVYYDYATDAYCVEYPETYKYVGFTDGTLETQLINLENHNDLTYEVVEYDGYIYFDGSWESVYVYLWTDGQGSNNDWPGVKIEKDPDLDLYVVDPESYAKVLFNNGSGNQTADIVIRDDIAIVYYQSGVERIKVRNTYVCEEHNWNSCKVTKDPTCDTTGIKTYTCTVCGSKMHEDIPALGHDFDYESAPVWKWTLTDSATATFTCNRDSEHKDIINATITSVANGSIVTYTASVTVSNHTYTSEKIVDTSHTHNFELHNYKAASCSEAGNLEYYYCTGCNKYFDTEYEETTLEAVTISKLSHTIDVVLVAKDNLEVTCTVCGEVVTLENDPDTLYFVNTGDWSNVYIYLWYDDTHNNHAWPGEAMTNTSLQYNGHDIYSYSIKDTEYTKVIFNKGSGGTGNQTGDLTIPSDSNCYIYNDSFNYVFVG